MLITSVDVMALHEDRASRAPSASDGEGPWRPIVCRIFTDEGIYGDGEAALTYSFGAPAAYGMLQDLSTLIVGMNPLDNEVIWDKLYKSTFWGQNGGPVIFAAIGALDMAVWDIKGKYFNVPVHQLLGGKRRDQLRTYASQLQFGWGPSLELASKTEDYARNARVAVEEGYDAIKIDFFTYARDGRVLSDEDTTRLLPPRYVNLVEERVAAVREAVGPDVDIIMENHSFLDANSAVQLGLRVQKYNIFFYEEPNTPTPKLTKYIGDKLQMPIASGERIYSRWQYAPYFENSSLQVIQPDIGNCGGITEVKKICDMAYTYDVSVQAHVCSSPLSTVAALHLESVIPNFVIHEHHVFNLHEYNKQYCVHDYQPVDGKYSVPDLPGLGNEWSEYALTTCDKVTVK